MRGAIPPLSQYVFMAWCLELCKSCGVNLMLVRSPALHAVKLKCIDFLKDPSWVQKIDAWRTVWISDFYLKRCRSSGIFKYRKKCVLHCVVYLFAVRLACICSE
jgi:hypothetical protein